MKIQLEINDNSNIVSLDQIINLIVDNAELCPEPSSFAYTKSHDQIIMSEIKKYSRNISGAGIESMEWQELEDTVESMSEKLFDFISAANLDYLKHGMKFGARLLMELIA